MRSLRAWWMPEGWRVLVFDDRMQMDQHLAATLAVLANEGGLRRVALASGSTFTGFFRLLRGAVDEGRIRLDGVTFHHVDEFEGVGPEVPGSLAREIRAALFPDADPKRGRFSAVDARPGAESTERHESGVSGCDLVLLGIGRNGHLAFNEPGTPIGSRAHFATLAAPTREGHAAAFGARPVPARALTAGIQTLLSARRLVLAAAGASKAAAVRDALFGPLAPGCPASALRLHDHVTVLLDAEAAARLLDAATPFTVPPTAISEAASDLPPGPTLVIAPHPDDASISCGGLLASLDSDSMRHIVTFSTGARAVPAADAEEARAVRERESEEEAEIQGASVSFLRARSYDTGVFEPADAAALLECVARCRPVRVLLPAREDPHPTHRLCRLTAEEALRAWVGHARQPFEAWTYEGPWCQLPRDAVNLVLKIGREAHDRKQAGIRAHRSQVDRVPFDAGADALERLRAIGFSESHLGGRRRGGFDRETRVECYRRVVIGQA